MGFRQKLFLNLQLNVNFLSRAYRLFWSVIFSLFFLFFVVKWQVLFSRIGIMLFIVVNQ